MARKQWSDLSDGERKALLVAAGVEIVLTTVALVDLSRRPGEQVRGKKFLWLPVLFVQPVGPVAYLVWGRRKP